MKVTDLRARAETRSVAWRIAAVKEGDLTPAEYRRIVERVVERLAQRLQPGTEVYRRSLGAFPTIVKESLNSLSARTRPRLRQADGAAHAASDGITGKEHAPGGASGTAGDGTVWEGDDFDPVDGQWYFDRPSVQRLLSQLTAATRPGATRSMLAMGAPTIANPAARAGWEVTLLDRSEGLTRESLGLAGPAGSPPPEVIDWDLGEKPYLDAQQMDAVIMDPPWYMEHYRAWLHTAVEACRVGGLIGVVLPQVLTNRRSVADRRDLLGILKSLGQVSIRGDLLSYVTPSFERSVLDMHGIGFLGRWRHADLALVRLRTTRMPYEFRQVDDVPWTYRKIAGRVVRTCGESVWEQGMPVIQPADTAAGYRLSSVSRWYFRSHGINLVTSRGRAAVVSHWGRLPLILDLLGKGHPPETAVRLALPDADAAGRQELLRTLAEILSG